MTERVTTGSCLCGQVKLRLRGELPAPVACHCVQCRKWTGHHEASTEVKRDRLEIEGEVRWYQSSEKARRGFCPECGSPLLFAPVDTDKHDWMGVAMGALDGPTGLRLARHIFVSEKGDYYELTDGLPQNPR